MGTAVRGSAYLPTWIANPCLFLAVLFSDQPDMSGFFAVNALIIYNLFLILESVFMNFFGISV